MAIKLGDIAKKAGVSLSTVSRVINGDKNISVSKETEEKIWKYVNELGYKTNKLKAASGKNKRKNISRTKNIGYILTHGKEEFEDSFFAKVIHGIEQELIMQRHNLCFAYTAYDLEDPVVLNHALNSGCDGVIFIGTIPIDLYNLFVRQIPSCIAIFDVPYENPVDCITVDFEKYAYLLVKEIIKLGHRHIAFIGGTNYFTTMERSGEGNIYNFEGRFRGYLKALYDSGIGINYNIIKDGNWDIETAYKKMGEILDSNEKVTALFAAGDRMAIGAMRAIQERGKNVPDDISLVGFDDIEIARYLNPPLTTVYYPKDEMGRIAVKTLIEKINNLDNKCLAKTIILPSNIVERGSVKKIKDF